MTPGSTDSGTARSKPPAGMVAGIAAGGAVAGLAAATTVLLALRRRRRRRRAAAEVPPKLVIGEGGSAYQAPPGPPGSTSLPVDPRLEQLAILPAVVDPLEEALATVPTRPGGPSPASLASLVNAEVSAGVGLAASQ